MKPIFLFLALFCATALMGKKAHPGPCPKAALHIALRHTPVIVYGKFIALDSSIYTLQVEEVLKGHDIPNILQNIGIRLDSKRPSKNFFNKNNQVAAIYYLSKNSAKGWTIDYGYCMPRQLEFDRATKKIVLGAQLVSFANFRTGLALFMQNYEQLTQQKAKGRKMVAPKNIKNATYRFLVNNMNEPDISKY